MPELIFGGVLIVIAMWITWVVAEQTGYVRGFGDALEHFDKPKPTEDED